MSGWDVHTHLVPPSVIEAARRGAHGLAIANDVLAVQPGARLPLRRLGDPEALLDWIADQRLDGAVVSVPPPLFRYDLSPGMALSWARLVNDGLAELAGRGAGRFRVLGQLPLADPGTAVEVASKLLDGDGFAGVALGTSCAFDDPGLEPLWQVLDRFRAFVLVHPGHSPDPRLESHYLANLLGNPYETAVAAAQLVFGDVLGRFPGIRFCLCHGGGATAAVVGRWQRGVVTRRPGIEPLTLPPREAVKTLYADDLVHDRAVLGLVLDTFGDDHVLVGSDWPFPMGCDRIDRSRAAARAALTARLTTPGNI